MTTTTVADPSGPKNVGRLDRRVLIGILFMCGAGALFPIMNGLVKELSGGFDSMQIVWARTLGHLIFVLVLFAPRRGLAIFKSRKLPWQVGRSLLLLASTAMFFTAVKDIPLAKAASISFTAPLIVALLALPILGERIGPARLTAVLIGFGGVLIVIRPGSELFQWASLLIVGSSSCYALYQIFTRKVAGHDAPETSVVYSALIGTLITSFIVPFVWTTPVTWRDGLIMASLGVFGGLGHYCVARSMTYAAANIVSPFQYFQMVGSVVVGYVLQSHLPDGYTWLGAAIIIGSGLYIGWAETRAKQVPAASGRTA
ncbi:MAG: DMT family transporter [Alphaproteobacteria bacterium]|nr:DMT family transporter [Alphaproteobacteria bacterium]